MDFSLSAEQRELKEAAAAFASAKLNQDLAEREEAGEFPLAAWGACAEFGIQGLPVPAELGGGGADILTTVLVMEALGYGCHDNGLIFSLNAQLWSLELPLVKFGTPAQQRAYLPGLIAGDLIGVHAMTEPESGRSDLAVKIRGLSHGDPATVRAEVQRHRDRHVERLDAYLANEKREFPDPSRLRGARLHQWLVLRGGIALERSLIDWYDVVLATLDKKAHR